MALHLQSHSERWLSTLPAELIASCKTHRNWKLACTVVEAATPVIQKMKEVYVSEVGNIDLFLYVTMDMSQNAVLASIIRCEKDHNNMTPLHSVENEEVKDLVAAFVCNFPDATFSIDGGIPLQLFIKKPNLIRYVTLNNFLDAAANKWTEFAIAVPKFKDKDKEKTLSATLHHQKGS